MKSLKVLLLSVLMTVFCIGGALANGEKIAYVDLSRLFDQYQKTKEYDAVLEGQHKDYQEERSKKLEKLKESQSKLSLLKEKEKAKIQDQIERQKTALLEFDRQKQMDLRKKRDEKIREILLEIEDVVRRYAEQKRISAVLNDRVLIYGSKSLDLTEDVLKDLNASYSKKK